MRERTMDHVTAGTSNKCWTAVWRDTGEPVRTPEGELTVFRISTEEAKSYESTLEVVMRKERDV
jgi:hypothetical protein